MNNDPVFALQGEQWSLPPMPPGLGGWIGYLIAGFIGACLLIWIVGGRSHCSQFSSELSIAFREVGRLSFSIVLMRFGARPLLDG
jgi:hypothetical protein